MVTKYHASPAKPKKSLRPQFGKIYDQRKIGNIKCLQEFFDRHDDELHGEFRHIRNAFDAVLGSLRFAEKVTTQSRQIAALASVHRMLRSRIPPPEDTAQLPLF